jgi:hypothetical protein
MLPNPPTLRNWNSLGNCTESEPQIDWFLWHQDQESEASNRYSQKSYTDHSRNAVLMNQYLNWAGATVLLSASVVAWSHPAIASTYRSSTNNTVVVLQETSPPSAKLRGYYFTKSAGRSWGAILRSQPRMQEPDRRFIRGHFRIKRWVLERR